MPTFVMICGPAGSGKSTYAESFLTEYYDAVYLSSDIYREQITGDVNDQDHNAEVFFQMNDSARAVLEQDVNVVYDATNLTRRLRKMTLKLMPECERICYCFNVPLDECLAHNQNRERHVPDEVIRRHCLQLQIPTYDEGWDKIILMNEGE